MHEAAPSAERWSAPDDEVAGQLPDDELRAAVLELEPGGIALLAGDVPAVRLANRAFRRAMPDPELDPLRRTVDEIWPTEAGLELRATVERVLQTGEPASFERLAQPGRDGALRCFAYHVQRISWRGAPAALLVLWETTEVEEARRQAERSRERAELLAALAADLNAGVGLDAVLGTAVRRAAALLGAEDGAVWLLEEGGATLRGVAELEPRQRLGMVLTLADLPSTAAAVQERAARLFRRGESPGLETTWLAEHGMMACLVVPLLHDGGVVGLLFLNYERARFLPTPRDVAFAEAIAGQCALALGRARVYEAERAARARAEAAEQEARRAERLQERLAAVVGHDLRTPLQAISMAVALLELRQALGEDDRRALGRIASSAANMEHIISDLLDFARVRAGGGVPVSFAPVRLDEVARAALQELELARGRRIPLAVEGDPALQGDPSRLGQLVANLCGFALRKAPAGSRLAAAVRGEGELVTVAVEVEGLALPGGDLSLLFEPFREPGEISPGGAGLGLFIVREIARAHRGAVEVVTGPAATRIAVRLPRAPGAG